MRSPPATKHMKQFLVPSLVLAAMLSAAPSAWAADQPAHRVPLSGDAKCNNGEPAVFYFRPGTGDNRSKYLIVLSGGGLCGGDLGCATRWQDATGDEDDYIGWHANMVPKPNLTMQLDDRGILDFDGSDLTPISNHPFDGYSRIYVPYCSSDQWTGMGAITQVDRYQDVNGDGVLDDLFPTVNGDALPETNGVVELYFGGSKIIEGVIGRVIQGYDEDPDTIPTEIVLVGSSAGGNGVNANLDLVADQIAMAPNDAAYALVYGISDSANELGVFANNVPNQGSADWLRERVEYYSGGPGSTPNVAVDESCIAAEVGLAKQKCFYLPYALANHVQTPLFLVGNAYDAVNHGWIFDDLTCVTDPLTSSLVVGCAAPAQARAWIRDHISNLGAPQLSSSMLAGPSGYYIANFAFAYHELTKRNSTFWGSADNANLMSLDPNFGIGPRLGQDPNDERSIATTVACFRDKLLYGDATLVCDYEVRSTIIP
jgi:hypothetical protein